MLNEHKTNCITISGKQVIEMPEKSKNLLKFDNYNKQLPIPFVIYADFEAITEKVHRCKLNDDKSYYESYQNHKD